MQVTLNTLFIASKKPRDALWKKKKRVISVRSRRRIKAGIRIRLLSKSELSISKSFRSPPRPDFNTLGQSRPAEESTVKIKYHMAWNVPNTSFRFYASSGDRRRRWIHTREWGGPRGRQVCLRKRIPGDRRTGRRPRFSEFLVQTDRQSGDPPGPLYTQAHNTTSYPTSPKTPPPHYISTSRPNGFRRTYAVFTTRDAPTLPDNTIEIIIGKNTKHIG